MSDDTFIGNTATDGGALANDWFAHVSGSVFPRNKASSHGAGIYNIPGMTLVTLHTTVVENNHPDNCAPANSVAGCTG